MDGEIGVDSPESGGANFWFTIKLRNTERRVRPAENGDVLKSRCFMFK